MVGRDIRRRPAKPGGRELAGLGLLVRYGKNGGWRCWPAGAGRECAGGRKALGSGLLAGQAGNKDASCWKMYTSCFCARKIRACFSSVCRLNFVLLFSAAGAALPGKTKQKKKLEKICSDGEKSGILYI